MTKKKVKLYSVVSKRDDISTIRNAGNGNAPTHLLNKDLNYFLYNVTFVKNLVLQERDFVSSLFFFNSRTKTYWKVFSFARHVRNRTDYKDD